MVCSVLPIGGRNERHTAQEETVASTPILSAAAAKAKLDAITTTLGSTGELRLYAGAVPANLADAPGTLLVTMTATGTMFAAATGSEGDATVSMVTSQELSGTATAGTAAYYRLYTSGGTVVFQDTVGTSGEGLNLTNNVLAASEIVTIASGGLTLSEPTGD
jgi:hypothetical protein